MCTSSMNVKPPGPRRQTSSPEPVPPLGVHSSGSNCSLILHLPSKALSRLCSCDAGCGSLGDTDLSSSSFDDDTAGAGLAIRLPVKVPIFSTGPFPTCRYDVTSNSLLPTNLYRFVDVAF